MASDRGAKGAMGTKTAAKKGAGKGTHVAAEKTRQPPRVAPSTQALGPETQAQLLALTADYASPTDAPVKTITHEARELQDVITKFGPTILARSRLSEALVADLPRRLETLHASESLWRAHHDAALLEETRHLRKEASTLRAAAVLALRHFLPHDRALQAEIDDLAEGPGLPALLDALRRLSPLLDAHAAPLAKAQLPPGAATRASELAELIQSAASGRLADGPTAEEARLLRNRAYWWLRACMDEIRECGRYAYPRSAAMQKLFQGTSSRRKQATRKPRLT
jgi:hypothetical protein